MTSYEMFKAVINAACLSFSESVMNNPNELIVGTDEDPITVPLGTRCVSVWCQIRANNNSEWYFAPDGTLLFHSVYVD